MSKQKNKGQNRPGQGGRVQVAPSAPTEPTREQAEKLGSLEVAEQELAETLGQPNLEGIEEPMLPTLEACLVRAETLLQRARFMERSARLQESQMVDREMAFSTREAELRTRVKDCDQRENEITEREQSFQAREVGLLDQAARLTARELNAEQGFLEEKARILRPLEDEVGKLRRERDQLTVEAAEVRRNLEAGATLKKAEMAGMLAEQQLTLSVRESEARRALEASIAALRKEQLDALQDELSTARLKAETDLRLAHEARTTELEAMQRELAGRAKELRHRAQDLQVEQEFLADDKGALAAKVKRLVDENVEQLRHELDSCNKQLADARADRDKHRDRLLALQTLKRKLGDRTPEQLLSHLDQLEARCQSLSQQLQDRPDSHVHEQLQELERQRSAWLDERAILQGDLAKTHGELATRRLAAIELESLRKQKEALEVHKRLLDGAVAELETKVEKLTNQDDSRNPMTALLSLDADEGLQARPNCVSPLRGQLSTLQLFAEDLRHRIAKGVEGRTLYYADRDVRAFLGGLAMTRLMLLQGISGTGKTSLPLAFAQAVGGGHEVVEVQAGWRDRQDLVGYYNAFHRHYYASNFLKALYKAGTPAYQDRMFLIILDEINLSRPEQFFADFLSALELPLSERKITLVNDPVKNPPVLMSDGLNLPIPPNVWFVGTANHDESTSEFAEKTYDRAHVMEMPGRIESSRFEVQNKGRRAPISHGQLMTEFEAAATRRSEDVEKATQWLRQAGFGKTLKNRFGIGWGNRLEQQLGRFLPVVVESGGSVGEAVDHLLVTKVMRKLKDRHDVRTPALEAFVEELDADWSQLDPVNAPDRTMELLWREIEAKKGEDA